MAVKRNGGVNLKKFYEQMYRNNPLSPEEENRDDSTLSGLYRFSSQKFRKWMRFGFQRPLISLNELALAYLSSQKNISSLYGETINALKVKLEFNDLYLLLPPILKDFGVDVEIFWKQKWLESPHFRDIIREQVWNTYATQKLGKPPEMIVLRGQKINRAEFRKFLYSGIFSDTKCGMAVGILWQMVVENVPFKEVVEDPSWMKPANAQDIYGYGGSDKRSPVETLRFLLKKHQIEWGFNTPNADLQDVLVKRFLSSHQRAPTQKALPDLSKIH